MPFPSLETSTFVAFVADNSANGIHRTGHSGGSFLAPNKRWEPQPEIY